MNSDNPQPRRRRSALRRLAGLLLALACILPLLVRAALPARASGLDFSAARSVPIQDSGRIKPLDTFARESVLFITGKERFEGRAAIDTIFAWMTDPGGARDLKIVDVSHHALRQALGLPDDVKRVSITELTANSKFEQLVREIAQKQQRSEELSLLDRQVQRLRGRVNLLSTIVSGEALTVVPNPGGPKAPWMSMETVRHLGSGDPGEHAGHQHQEALDKAVAARIAGDLGDVLEAYVKKDGEAFTRACLAWRGDCAAVAPASVPAPATIERELEYNNLHPFAKAWMVYLAALLMLLASSGMKGRSGGPGPVYWLAFAFAVGGLILHAYGFFLRSLISGRAPVTNMYESVVWVSFGAMLLALVLEAIYRRRSLLLSACVLSILSLVLADNTSSVLDPAINPLMPVLRNNFWLTIHVLTITLSYAGFLLALGMGHMILWSYAFHPEDRARRRSLHLEMYRTIQVGVLLLAAGTILGGVWANYSWGRFWGWDPKEVWALIALLGYLAILHGRYAGWLEDFGMAVSSIVAFLLVLMAWYGVNFILGAGLHSYGFGEGGQGWVGLVVALDLALVGALSWKYKRWEAARAAQAS